MDEPLLLSALQALVFYTIILMFPACDQISVTLVDPAIFSNLETTTLRMARTGLILSEEIENERPSWEPWIHITSKRRAVFCLFLLHWAYSVYHGLPSFECDQLGPLPAPPPKFLWEAQSKERWEYLYTRWLAQWERDPYLMREFTTIASGPSLQRRSEKWLEDADELGVLFFSIGESAISSSE